MACAKTGVTQQSVGLGNFDVIGNLSLLCPLVHFR
jgi:hypothetical protein